MHTTLLLPGRASAALRALAVGALLSTGCASATRVVVPAADRDRLGSARTVGALSQQELGVSVIASTGGAGFGLVGALVDSAVTNSRAKSAEAAVVPVRDALVGYEAGMALGAALKRELAPVAWLRKNAVEVRQLADTRTAVADLLKQSRTDVVLLVQADYRLTPAFDAIVVTGKVSLLPARPPALAAEAAAPADGEAAAEVTVPPPLFFNTLTTSVALPGWTPETKPEEAVKRWAANDGRAARRALDTGISELARMLAFDLEQGAPPEKSTYEAPVDAKIVPAVGKYANGKASGFVVREEQGRAWVRLPSGELSSVGELAL